MKGSGNKLIPSTTSPFVKLLKLVHGMTSESEAKLPSLVGADFINVMSAMPKLPNS